MCPSLVEIVQWPPILGIEKNEERKKKKDETTAVKYKPFGITMPCGLIIA